MAVRITHHKPSPPLIGERLAVSKKEAAALLGVSERSLNNWVKQGKIVARKCGNRVLFPLQALEDFINGAEQIGDTNLTNFRKEI